MFELFVRRACDRPSATAVTCVISCLSVWSPSPAPPPPPTTSCSHLDPSAGPAYLLNNANGVGGWGSRRGPSCHRAGVFLGRAFASSAFARQGCLPCACRGDSGEMTSLPEDGSDEWRGGTRRRAVKRKGAGWGGRWSGRFCPSKASVAVSRR